MASRPYLFLGPLVRLGALAFLLSVPAAPWALADEDDAQQDESEDEPESTGDEEEDDDLEFPDEELDLDVFDEGYEEGEVEEFERLEGADIIEEEAEPELDEVEDYGGDPEQEVYDFSDDLESEEVPIGGPGQDTARIYRQFKDKLEDLGPDEELISWERYLEQYPNSLFQDRIDARIDELSAYMFDERVPGTAGFGGVVDAANREIALSTPVLLENIDPRTKLRLGFEYGYPSWLNLVADYEYQLLRHWSVHGGLGQLYPGWNIIGGTKYALVKSSRTNTLVSGILDVHFNTTPFFTGLRPQVGFGQRIMVGGNPLDLSLQGGVDLEMRDPFQIRYIGGLNLTYQASDMVAFFAEGTANMKHLNWEEGGSFRFNVVAFGITYRVHKDMRTTLGASAPYSTNYWGYHFGSIMASYNYYMDRSGDW